MPEVVYILWDMHADSWCGLQRTFKGVFKTIEGAEATIPENIRNMEKEPYRKEFVRDFVYFTIEAVELGA